MDMRRRALCVWLPNWPITRWRRARKPETPNPHGLALMAVSDNAQRLYAIDAAAAAQGLARGQALTDALALSPLTQILEAEPEEDLAALTRLADWMTRFSPSVAIDAPDGLFADIDGCAHLWGGEESLARALLARLAAQNIPARVAIADTFAAAWALARFGGEVLTISNDDARLLAPLPVAALRIDEATCGHLRVLGLQAIGSVRALPRAALRKRLGVALMLQLGRAFGEESEAIRFRVAPARWAERAAFAEPISAPSDLQRVVSDLAAKLCERLDEQGLGARGFEIVFHRLDGDAAVRAIGTSLPLRDAKRILALFANGLETVDPGFGVEIATLRAEDVAPLILAQSDCDHTAAGVRNADLAPFIDRISNKYGPERVWRAAAFESHVPERAVAHAAPLAKPEARGWDPDKPRPIRVFNKPQPVEAFAVAPDDPPAFFKWQGRTHKIRHAEGPERIGSEWWRKPWAEQCGGSGVGRVRDYYCVEDEEGARFWVFRAGLYGEERAARWYLHGLFA